MSTILGTFHDSPVTRLFNWIGPGDGSTYPNHEVPSPPSIYSEQGGEERHSLQDLGESHVSRTGPDSQGSAIHSPAFNWGHDQDPEHPRNWTAKKKCFIVFVICLYTFVVYCASAICVPSIPYLVVKYDVSEITASLVLATYVLGYGIGPMFFSPLSEIALVDRGAPYIITFILFLIISICTSVVDDFAASYPALATGAATLEDIYDVSQIPYAFIFWVAAMYGGPALGPAISGYAVASNWRWPMYAITIMAGIVLPLLALLLETSEQNILLRRAARLRRSQDDHRYRAASEVGQQVGLKALFANSMIKPLEITVKDPAITFTAVYSAIVYSIYYSFFEAFPIVYEGLYQFSVGAAGLVFLVIIIALVIIIPVYTCYLRYVFAPKDKAGRTTFEDRLYLALYATWLPPAGLFLFAWTARQSVHWIWSTVGIGIYAGSSFVVFQCLICYIPLSYPRYVASLLAANDFCRSTVAAALVMTSRQMYLKMGIAHAVSLLGGLSFTGVIGMFILYHYGHAMRARSKFAES
ncbi:MFS transporter [Exophiala viscosa]|uniref:MFS transporter n=1 Tax=Exophiala viscosa TaxID=2486360 RepID=UPI0021916C17|nr:MFS transporter [Exophiala viscosa]